MSRTQLSQTERWKPLTGYQNFTADTLERLTNGEISGLVIPNILSPSTLTQWREEVVKQAHSASVVQYNNGQLVTLGPYLMRGLGDMDQYFTDAGTIVSHFEALHDCPVHRFHRLIEHALNCHVQTATDHRGKPFAPAIVRYHRVGWNNPLHSDLAKRDLPHHEMFDEINHLDIQLSAVLCLQDCHGGELCLYQRQWHESDERHKIPNGLGYHPKVVEGARCWRYRPCVGDLYIFHASNFHEVTQVLPSRDRLTMGCFLGFNKNRPHSAVAWA